MDVHLRTDPCSGMELFRACNSSSSFSDDMLEKYAQQITSHYPIAHDTAGYLARTHLAWLDDEHIHPSPRPWSSKTASRASSREQLGTNLTSQYVNPPIESRAHPSMMIKTSSAMLTVSSEAECGFSKTLHLI